MASGRELDPYMHGRRKADGYLFDSEYVLRVADKLDALNDGDNSVTSARRDLIGTSHVDPNFEELARMIQEATGMVTTPQTGIYAQVIEAGSTMLQRFGYVNRDASQNLHAVGTAYHEQDQRAWQRWIDAGHDLEDLRDGKRGPLVND